MAYYISGAYEEGAGNATLNNGSAVVTSSGLFGAVEANNIMVFNYTQSTYEYKGWWAVVKSKTSSSSITMDRNAPYSGSVPFKYSDYKADLGKILLPMRMALTSPMDVMGMPGQNTRTTLVYDSGGVIRTITVTAQISGDRDDVSNNLDRIERLMDGAQFMKNPYLLCLPEYAWWDNGGWYSVAIRDFNFDFLKTDGTIAKYTLVCIERW
jgi:hypothetical protein